MRRFLAALMLLLLACAAARGDELLLQNGNLIRGEVISEEDGAYVVEVDAGAATVEMTIPRERVRTVRRSGQQRAEAAALPAAPPAESVFAAPGTGGAPAGGPGGPSAGVGGDGEPPPLTTFDKPDVQDDDFIARAETELVRLEGVLEEAEREKAKRIVRELRDVQADMEAGAISPEDAMYLTKEVIPFRIDPNVEDAKRAIKDVKEAMNEWREYRGATWHLKQNLVPEYSEIPGEAGPESVITLVNEAGTPLILEMGPMGENGAEAITTTVEPGASGSVRVPNRKRYYMYVKETIEARGINGRLITCRGGMWVERGTDYQITARPEPEEE